MQETHCTSLDEVYWRTQAKGKLFCANDKSKKGGVAILISNKCVNLEILNSQSDVKGRWVTVEVKTDVGKIRLMSVYAPNDDSPSFFKELGDLIVNYEGSQIIGGDFNLTQDFTKDTLDRKTKGNVNAAKVLEVIKEEANIVDVYRLLHPDEQKFTCIKNNQSKNEVSFSRIDFFLVSKALLTNIGTADIMPGYKSDHAIPYLTMKYEQSIRGPGFWKINNSLLKEQNYKDQMHELFKEEKAKSYKDVFYKWMNIKAQIAGASIKYSTREKKSQYNKYNAIDRKINYWLEKLQSASNNELLRNKKEIWEHIYKLEQDKIELIKIKTRGASIRARRSWYLFGEKASSKYFFNLEKKNFMKKKRYQLKNELGEIKTNNKDILNIQNKYYAKLYRSRKIMLKPNYLEELNLEKLGDDDKQTLEQDVTEEEI